MTRSATRAIVRLAWLDLRAAPDHRAEMRSQLLLGETATVLARRAKQGWWRVENHADGYRGWARSWGFVPTSGTRVAEWRRRATARVAWPMAEVRTAPGGDGVPVTPAPLNARLIPGARRGGWRRVALPDGRTGWIESAALAAAGKPPPTVLERVVTLLGVPYLWGGRTPAGFDCSGLTQQVLAEAGVALPRDAHDQWKASRPLRPGEPPRPGDLVFFSGSSRRMEHVGLWLEGGVYAHCRGQVGFNSLDPADKALYHKDLSGQFRGIRRPHD